MRGPGGGGKSGAKSREKSCGKGRDKGCGKVSYCPAGWASVAGTADAARCPAPRRLAGQATIAIMGTRYASQAMTSIHTGYGWMPSTPVSSDESGVPGRTSQDRSKACAWPADVDLGRKPGRVHLRHRRREDQVQPDAGQLLRIALQRARIAVEIFVRRELRRVHKNAGDHLTRTALCLAHQRQVPVMQRAHRRHQTHARAALPPCAHLRPQIGDGMNDLWCFHAANIARMRAPSKPSSS